MQVAALVEQLELELGSSGRSLSPIGAVAEDQLARDAAARSPRPRPAQVAQDERQRRLVTSTRRPPFSRWYRPTSSLTIFSSASRRQLQREAQPPALQLRRQLDLVADHHDGVLERAAALEDLAQHALRAGVAEVGHASSSR
jgi:hypothetical protein